MYFLTILLIFPMKHRREIESINDRIYVNAQGVVIELNEKLLKISMYMKFPIGRRLHNCLCFPFMSIENTLSHLFFNFHSSLFLFSFQLSLASQKEKFPFS